MTLPAHHVKILKLTDDSLSRDAKRAASYFKRYGRDYQTEAAHRHTKNEAMVERILPLIAPILQESWVDDLLGDELLDECRVIAASEQARRDHKGDPR